MSAVRRRLARGVAAALAILAAPVAAAGCTLLAPPAPGALPEGALLVDVRPDEDAARAWLPGSVQEPGFAHLASRPMFRDQPLLLFGSGKDDARLQSACAALAEGREAPVWLVRGGLRGLLAAGHAAEGDRFALDALGVLAPEELHRLMLLGGVAIAELGAGAGAGAPALPDGVRRVRRAADADVVVLPPGHDPAAWRAAWRGPGTPPLLYVAGWAAYSDYRARAAHEASALSRTAARRCAG